MFGSVLVKRFLKRDQIICGSEKLKMQLLQTLYIAQLAPARAPDTMPHLLTMWAVQFPQVTYSPHAERDFASFLYHKQSALPLITKTKTIIRCLHEKGTHSHIASKKKVIL